MQRLAELDTVIDLASASTSWDGTCNLTLPHGRI